MLFKYFKLKYIRQNTFKYLQGIWSRDFLWGNLTFCGGTTSTVVTFRSTWSGVTFFFTFLLQFSYLFYLCTLFTLFALSTSNWFRPNLIPPPISFHLLPSQHSPDRPRLLLLPPALWSKVSQAILSSHSQTQSDIQVSQKLFLYLYLYLKYKW